MASHHDWGIDCETWFGGTPDDITPRQEARRRQGGRSVTEIALDVHCANTGSGEWYDEYDSDVQLLKDILASWTPSTNGCNVHKLWENVENSIKHFLEEVIKECDFYRQMRLIESSVQLKP